MAINPIPIPSGCQCTINLTGNIIELSDIYWDSARTNPLTTSVIEIPKSIYTSLYLSPKTPGYVGVTCSGSGVSCSYSINGAEITINPSNNSFITLKISGNADEVALIGSITRPNYFSSGIWYLCRGSSTGVTEYKYTYYGKSETFYRLVGTAIGSNPTSMTSIPSEFEFLVRASNAQVKNGSMKYIGSNYYWRFQENSNLSVASTVELFRPLTGYKIKVDTLPDIVKNIPLYSAESSSPFIQVKVFNYVDLAHVFNYSGSYSIPTLSMIPNMKNVGKYYTPRIKDTSTWTEDLYYDYSGNFTGVGDNQYYKGELSQFTTSSTNKLNNVIYRGQIPLFRYVLEFQDGIHFTRFDHSDTVWAGTRCSYIGYGGTPTNLGKDCSGYKNKYVELTRYDDRLQITYWDEGGSKNYIYYYTYTFPDKVIPMRMPIVLQAAGGGGSDPQGTGNGSGGGSGSGSLGILDFSVSSTFKIKLGYAGAGGYCKRIGGGQGPTGQDAEPTTVYDASGNIVITLGGGKGALDNNSNTKGKRRGGAGGVHGVVYPLRGYTELKSWDGIEGCTGGWDGASSGYDKNTLVQSLTGTDIEIDLNTTDYYTYVPVTYPEGSEKGIVSLFTDPLNPKSGLCRQNEYDDNNGRSGYQNVNSSGGGAPSYFWAGGNGGYGAALVATLNKKGDRGQYGSGGGGSRYNNQGDNQDRSFAAGTGGCAFFKLFI